MEAVTSFFQSLTVPGWIGLFMAGIVAWLAVTGAAALVRYIIVGWPGSITLLVAISYLIAVVASYVILGPAVGPWLLALSVSFYIAACILFLRKCRKLDTFPMQCAVLTAIGVGVLLLFYLIRGLCDFRQLMILAAVLFFFLAGAVSTRLYT